MEPYAAAVVQSNRISIARKSEIKKTNLRRALQLIDWACKMRGDFAPVALVAFPEVFLTDWLGGWEEKESPYDKYVNDIAIEIPGEETDILGKKATEHNTHLACSALEHDPKFPEYFFNCAYIIDPQGKVILKYRKVNPATTQGELSSSPHELLDRYIKEYGTGKTAVETFYPVADTKIGRLGMMIAFDGLFPETARALALQGCEVIIRSSAALHPYGSPPYDDWEITNRCWALVNSAYVIAPSPARIQNPSRPEYFGKGYSMIVDYTGMILTCIEHAGEAVSYAILNIDTLRKHRLDRRYSLLPLIRTETFRDIYSRAIYPPNVADKKPIKSNKERRMLKPVDECFRGVFASP
jgi:predicted amidohydrolase